MRKQFVAVATVLSSLIIVGSLNILLYDRDGVVTAGMPSFSPRDILFDKLWTEAPPQVLATFFTKGAKFYGADDFQYTHRLETIFGDASLIRDEGIIDVRERMPQDQLDEFLDVFQTNAYRDLFPCPHDELATCEVGVAWDRARTKEPGINIIFARFTESKYMFFDDSLIVPRD